MERTTKALGAAATAIAVTLTTLWAWPRDESVNRADGERRGSAQAQPVDAPGPEPKTSVADGNRSSDEGVADAPGRVRGEIVAPGEGKAEPSLTVRDENAAVARKKEDEGTFEVGYERDPDGRYTLEVDAPGMKPVVVPLPTANENVGKIVLRPALGYRGTLVRGTEPVTGVSVSLRDELGRLIARAVERSDEKGEFEVRVARPGFSRLTLPSGEFQHVYISFAHDADSFASVRAHLDGFGPGHTIELVNGTRFVFQLGDGSDRVPIRVESCVNASVPESVGRAVFAQGQSRDGGRFPTAWPETIPAAWVCASLPDGDTWYGAVRTRAVSAPTIDLSVSEIHEVRIRTRLRRSPVAGAEVLLRIVRRGDVALAGWLRGTTNETGELRLRLGASSGFPAVPVEVLEASVLYAEDGVPVRETFDFVKKGRGHRTDRLLDLRLGRSLESPNSLWLVCTDTNGGVLTPVRVAALVHVPRGVGLLAGGRPRAVKDSLGAHPGLFEIPQLALREEGRFPDATAGTLVVETEEQGTARFDVTRTEWLKAASAASPLRVEFPVRRKLERRLRVVDDKGVAVSRAWVTAVPTGIPARFRHLDWSHASTDVDGTVPLAHLWPEQTYELYVHDVRDGRTGFVESYRPETSSKEIVVVLQEPESFQTGLDLDAEQFKNPQGLTIRLCSWPEGILPTIPCTLGDGRIRAVRATGLAGYRLRISAFQFGRGMADLKVPAADVQGGSVSFPE